MPLSAGTWDFLVLGGAGLRMVSFQGSEPEAASLGFFENRHLLNQMSRGLVVLSALGTGACLCLGISVENTSCILLSLDSSGEGSRRAPCRHGGLCLRSLLGSEGLLGDREVQKQVPKIH